MRDHVNGRIQTKERVQLKLQNQGTSAAAVFREGIWIVDVREKNGGFFFSVCNFSD